MPFSAEDRNSEGLWLAKDHALAREKAKLSVPFELIEL